MANTISYISQVADVNAQFNPDPSINNTKSLKIEELIARLHGGGYIFRGDLNAYDSGEYGEIVSDKECRTHCLTRTNCDAAVRTEDGRCFRKTIGDSTNSYTGFLIDPHYKIFSIHKHTDMKGFDAVEGGLLGAPIDYGPLPYLTDCVDKVANNGYNAFVYNSDSKSCWPKVIGPGNSPHKTIFVHRDQDDGNLQWLYANNL